MGDAKSGLGVGGAVAAVDATIHVARTRLGVVVEKPQLDEVSFEPVQKRHDADLLGADLGVVEHDVSLRCR